MGPKTASKISKKRGTKFVPFKGESLERKLVVAFGFMSFIPILLIVLTMVYRLDLGATLYLIVASVFIGYFLVARKMIKSVLMVADRAREIASGKSTSPVEVSERDEIGELARAFNRITQELEEKIEELESSRQLVKKLLSRIGTAIVSYEGIDNILNLIIENTVGALDAQMGSLMLVDGEKSDLYVKTAWSRDGLASKSEHRVKLGDDIPGWVAKEGKVMRTAGSPSSVGFADTTGAKKEGVILCVPLGLRDQTIGVISVIREDKTKTFGDDDESLLSSIGSQIAVAVENYRLNLDVEHTYVETIMALALAVEAKDPYSAGHSKRVGFYARSIGERLGLDEESLRALEAGGVLHDIGKIGIRDEILTKKTELTPDEERIMQQHPLIGEAILRPVRSLRKVVSLVRHHHEHYDGTGYPSGLEGDDTPLGARILAVVDAYDTMVTDRPYRRKLSNEATKAELQKSAGSQFDPTIVKALFDFLDTRKKG